MDQVIQGRSGCYGKIPRLGDFLTRSLDRQVVALWDEWLQDGLAVSREQLGDEWLDYYSVAPVWNFAAAAGALGQSTWLGVMIPSVDRVGRYFPFTVMVDAGDCSPLAALYCWQGWFDQARSLALDCLEDGFDPDSLAERLMALPDADQPADRLRPSDSWMPLHDAGRHYRLGSSVSTRDVLSAVGTDALAEIYPGFSIWWTQGSDRIASCLLVERGLPSASGFAGLLDGNFEAAGWEGGGTIGSQVEVDPAWDLDEEQGVDIQEENERGMG
jgi:type VI secretion system protein ImpM